MHDSLKTVIISLAVLGANVSAAPPKCPDDGLSYIPDYDDCNIYYICEHGNYIEITCPEGQHFSEELEECTDPETANCTPKNNICADVPGLAYLPDPQNCTTYYICSNGEAFHRECPDGQHFSPTFLNCMHPAEAQCDSEWKICPSEELSTQPHPNNCTKFYVCDQGNPILQSCPEGQHYSVELKKCTDPETAQCNKISSSGPPEETTSSMPGTTDLPTTSGPSPTTSEPSKVECPPEGNINIAHPTDCTKFYACVDGIPYLIECPPGLHFNPEAQVCDYPETAGCESGIITSTASPPGTTNTQPEQSTPQGSSSTSLQSSTTSSSKPEPECNPGDDFLLPHEDCTKFYECFDGQLYIQTCPEDLYFNPATGECDYHENVDCTMP